MSYVDLSTDGKKDILAKYVRGLGEIWKKLIDEAPEDPGDPLALYPAAVNLTEKSLRSLLED